MKTIIHIDDDPDDIILFEEVINCIDESLLLKSFRNGKSAITFLQDGVFTPNIIFLDVNMPGISGSDALQLIRKIKVVYDVPIIMFSTTIHKEDKGKLEELGASAFLEKADQFDRMKAEVETILWQFLK